MPANKVSITAFRNQELFKDAVSIDTKKTYEVDFSAWAEDNNNITSATWTVERGQASVSNEALSSNVASALITFTQIGRNLIKIVGDTGTEAYVVWFDIYVRDQEKDFVSDYDYVDC